MAEPEILPRAFPTVQGRCPACGLAALFVGDGGYITCGNLPCPDPCAASNLLTGPAGGATSHVYLSTGCLHGEHGYCQGKTGRVGAKAPAKCKFCDATCRCECHQADQ